MLILLLIADVVIIVFAQMQWRRTMRGGVSPAALYGMVWGVVWLMNLSGAMGYFKISDRGVFYSSLPLLGIFCGEMIFVPSTSHGVQSQRALVLNASVFKRWVLITGAVSVIIGSITLVSSFLVFGPFWSTGAEALKTSRVLLGTSMYDGTPLAMLVKYSNLLQGFSFAGAILSAMYLKFVDSGYWLGSLLPCAGALLFDFAWGSRVDAFYVVLMIVLVPILVPDPRARSQQDRGAARQLRKILLLGILVIGAGVVLDFISALTRQDSNLQVNGRSMPLSLVQFVDYQVGTFVSFDQTIDNNSPTWGRMSFWGFEQWLRLLRIVPYSVSTPEQLISWEMEYPYYGDDFQRSGNVFTWLRYLYSDFGVPGMFLLPLGFSIFAAVKTRRSLTSGRGGLGVLLMLAIWYSVILHSPNIMLFHNDSDVLCIGILFFAHRQTTKQHLAVEQPSITRFARHGDQRQQQA